MQDWLVGTGELTRPPTATHEENSTRGHRLCCCRPTPAISLMFVCRFIHVSADCFRQMLWCGVWQGGQAGLGESLTPRAPRRLRPTWRVGVS